MKEIVRINHFAIRDEDEDSNMPIHIAASRGHAKVVEVLLQNGADVEARYLQYTRCRKKGQNCGASYN